MEELKEQVEEKKERIEIVPDIHCRFEWIEHAEQRLKDGKCDKLVFLGDYCDSFTHSNLDMVHTVTQVIRVKQENPDKVELLIGNHDLPYMNSMLYGACSGFRPDAYPEVSKLFADNDKLFNIAYQKGKHLFSHAGVINRWLHLNKDVMDKWREDGDTIADTLNRIRFTHNVVDLYSVGRARGGTRWNAGGPMWADMVESIVDALLGYHQYVGHTPIKAVRKHDIDHATSIMYLDTLPHDTAPKVIEL